MILTDWERKKEHPGTSGKIEVGQRECPKGPSVKKHYEVCSDPVSADPICPFPSARAYYYYVLLLLVLLLLLLFYYITTLLYYHITILPYYHY